MNHVTLNGAGTNDGDLDDKVVECARPETRQHVHLGPAFDLEHTETVAFAQHVIGRRIVRRNGCQIEAQALMSLKEVEGLANAGQHAEGQHIDLQDPESIYVVLVPFDEGTIGHGRITNWYGLDKRSPRQDETADMLGQVPGEADQLACQGNGAADHRAGGIKARLRDLGGRNVIPPTAPDTAGERGGNILCQTERLADFANGRAGPIGNDSRCQGGALAPVALVDILDHFLAPFVFEVDIDVGRFLAFA